MKKTRIIIAGCAGRMGKRVAALGFEDPRVSVAGAFECASHAAIGSNLGSMVGLDNKNIVIVSNAETELRKGDIIIDFTSPAVTLKNVKKAIKEKAKMVIGTTGLSKSEQAKIRTAAKTIPIVFAPNMSVGVNLLFKISNLVGSVLGDDYDIEIIEAHHKHKKDAPSGTACELARQAALGRRVDIEKKALYGRKGFCGTREKGTIGIHAVRGGDVVGEHTVSFLADGERIELSHRASSRDAFAKGAITAALFLVKKTKGLFSMQDVLGIR